ncbi:hypothetical protein [Nocardioides sp. CFH 31398]|uniref:hypothetical protein n=1 Tax=Nocardioides sp. CFH 31398 TaxID=2919579 RepID=UPI001F054137|nr:hypothetical protein [Nocardioides sp. CFH 31398]MCH1865404.1 hypothetical protein [Nocardioides sp. CFH 31398]
MTIQVVKRELTALSSDIDDAVADSVTRTIPLAASSPETYGDATLSGYVDSAKESLQATIRAMATDAQAAAASVRDQLTDFSTTDTGSADAMRPAGGGVPV